MPDPNIVQELYKGTIRVKYVDSNHSYWVSKKVKGEWTAFERSTGVTTFIGIKDKSTPIKYWVARISYKFLIDVLVSKKREITKFDLVEARDLHAKRLEEAATIGSKIHDWIENYIKGTEPTMPQEDVVLQGINAFLDWEKKHKVTFLESEVLLYSKEHGYCGRADAIARIGKKKYLIDFKTSNGVYNDVMLQTAAYAHAYEEMGLGKIDGRWEIRLEKRSPEEFQLEMDEKGRVNEVYRPFEAVELPGTQDDDFAAFVHFRAGYEWDKTSRKLLDAAVASAA